MDKDLEDMFVDIGKNAKLSSRTVVSPGDVYKTKEEWAKAGVKLLKNKLTCFYETDSIKTIPDLAKILHDLSGKPASVETIQGLIPRLYDSKLDYNDSNAYLHFEKVENPSGMTACRIRRVNG